MREIIRMNSTGKTKEGKPTGYFRTTTINKKTNAAKGKTGKREQKHFDPRAWNEKADRCGMMVVFKEGKIK